MKTDLRFDFSILGCASRDMDQNFRDRSRVTDFFSGCLLILSKIIIFYSVKMCTLNNFKVVYALLLANEEVRQEEVASLCI